MKKILHFILFFVCAGSVSGQYTVTGTVTDAKTKEPIIGANVIVQNTTRGTLTDFEGNFSYTTQGNQNINLVITYLGYLSQTINASPSDNKFDVVLQEDVTNLEEVVVTGLASSIKRSNLANAVTSLSARELVGTTTIQTTDGALYGKVAGANIRSNGGAPGGGMSIQLRGISSLAGASQPLIILDGVYINNSFQRSGRATVTGAGASNQDDGANRLADLNPADIETVEVLKGPSAAAIYGTRANAGVIIINTKRGASGKTTISFAQDIGSATPLRLLGVDNWSPEKINFFFPAARRAVELERFNAAKGNFIDYEDYFYNNNAPLYNSRLTVVGGDDKTKFYVSGNMTNEKGTVRRTGFDRYSVRANLEHKITNNIKISTNSNYINTNTDRGFTGNQNNTGASIGYNIAYVPNYFDLRPNAQGIYPVNPYFSENPIAVTDHAINNSEVNRFLQSFNLTAGLFQSATANLKFSLTGGLDYIQNSTLVYLPEFLQFQKASANPGDVLSGRSESLNTNFQSALVFTKIVDKLSLTSQGGIVRLDFKNSSLFNRGRGLVPSQKNLRQANIQEINEDFKSIVREAGIFFQQEANFDDKIIATVGIRGDKSTLNGDANKLYYFPRASLALNLTKFDFWKFNTVSQLKPRAAYGETSGPVAFGATFTPLGGANIGGLLGSTVSTQIGNVNIFPERATELEFGLDAGFFNNKIGLEATWYRKNTKDNIQNLTLSPSTGVSSTPSNEAELENKGIELGLSGTPFDSKNFRWNTRVLFWRNRVLLTRLGIPTYFAGAFGTGLGTFLYAQGYAPTTIIGAPANPENPAGFTFWGDNQPNFNMSFSNSFNFFKYLDFSFLVDWKDGGDNINLTSFLSDSGGTTNGWFNDDNNDGVPNGRQRPPAPFNNAGRWVQDASFVKIREIGLYYTLPKSILSGTFKDHVKGMKIGASANNVFLFTKYEGYDPETSTFGAQAVANNVDIAPYPTQRRIFFHLNLDF
jgi:TonB-linked SusC/RagA family outer membrane protein